MILLDSPSDVLVIRTDVETQHQIASMLRVGSNRLSQAHQNRVLQKIMDAASLLRIYHKSNDTTEPQEMRSLDRPAELAPQHSKQDQAFMDRFNELIAKVHSNEYIQRADLAAQMALSERQLQRKVKSLFGTSPLHLLREYRLNQGRRLLEDGLRVNQVSDLCGFGSQSYFGACFKRQFGQSPKQYQQNRHA